MPKYLIQANYTVEGMKGLLKDGGTGRRAALEQGYQAIGGKLEALYFAFGNTDVFVIGEVPDNVSMTALALAVGASGAASTKVTVLMTPEEIDQATKKLPKYQAPGQA